MLEYSMYPRLFTKKIVIILLVFTLLIVIASSTYFFTHKQSLDDRGKAASAPSSLNEVLTATGINNITLGNTTQFSKDDSISGLFTGDAVKCVPANVRFEIVFNKNIPHIFGAGMNYPENKGELSDFLDTHFTSGSYNAPFTAFNGDTGRMRTPVFSFPQESLIVGYIQPFPKMVRLSRTATSTTLVMKRNENYSEGGCGQFFAVKGTSIVDAYNKYNIFLKRRFFFKKPHWNAYGVGWETAMEYGCNTSLTKDKFAFTQYKNAGIPLSIFVNGSGYWNSINTLGCGTSDPSIADEPTMDALAYHPNFGTYADVQTFFNELKANNTYPMLGMRHSIPPGKVTNIANKLRAAGLPATTTVYYPNANPATPYTFYGTEPSNNVKLLNTIPNPSNTNDQPVIKKYIQLLQQAYGGFKGIKEDEMIVGDQVAYAKDRGITGEVHNLPDGTVKSVYAAYDQYFNNDFVIMGRNDYFGVGTDLTNGPGYLPGMPTGNGVYNIKYWLDTDFIHITSGYPHVKNELDFAQNPDGTIKDQKEFLRGFQAEAFMAADEHSKGFWHLTDQAIKNEFIYFAQLRERLHSYTYDHAMKWYETGVPSIMRPLFFDYQNDPNSYAMYTVYQPGQIKNEFMMGNALLIRPILDANDTFNVYFPQGTWYDIFTGQQYNGNQTSSYTVNTASSKFPAFAKGGEPFILQNSLTDVYQSRVHVYPANNYQTSYRHFLKNGSLSGTITVYIQGTWDWNRIVVKDTNGTPIQYEKGQKGDIQFNMENGKSYTITMAPAATPSATATMLPTQTMIPTLTPTMRITTTPAATTQPTNTPTTKVTTTPTLPLTPTPTIKPTSITLTPQQTLTPTKTPTANPSVTLTSIATQSPTSTPLSCTLHPEGDANCDGSIDLLDFELFRQDYLAFLKGNLDITTAKADFNKDKSIDLLDFEAFRQGYLKYTAKK